MDVDVELTVTIADNVVEIGMHVEREYAEADVTIDDDVTGHDLVAAEYVSAWAAGK